MRSDVTYRFSIVNLSKPESLYTCGMRPVLYSETEAETHYVGWSRVGHNIRYYRHGCQMAIARFLDRMCLALWA